MAYQLVLGRFRKQDSPMTIRFKVNPDVIVLSSVVEMFNACRNALDRQTLQRREVVTTSVNQQ